MELGFKQKGDAVIPIVAETGEEVDCVQSCCEPFSSSDSPTYITITYIAVDCPQKRKAKG